MPAAAVIPAPIAYTKVVAVKKLVVGFLRGWGASRPQGLGCAATPAHPATNRATINLVALGDWLDYFEQTQMLQVGNCLQTLAWNND